MTLEKQHCFGRDEKHLSSAGNELVTNVLQINIGNNRAPAAMARTRPQYFNNGFFNRGPNYRRRNYWMRYPQVADT